MTSANFKIHPINDQDSCLDHDPKYLQYLEQKAEEERMTRMLEKNLEPC